MFLELKCITKKKKQAAIPNQILQVEKKVQILRVCCSLRFLWEASCRNDLSWRKPVDTTPKPSTNATEENSLKYLCYLITVPAVHPSTEVNRSIAAVPSHHPRLLFKK